MEVIERGLVARNQQICSIAESTDEAVSHDIGPINELVATVVNSPTGQAEEHQWNFQFCQGFGVQVKLPIFQKVATAKDHAMAVLIDLMNGLGREARSPVTRVACGRGDVDQINDLAKGLGDTIHDAEEDRIIAYVEADGPDAEEIDHGRSLGD